MNLVARFWHPSVAVVGFHSDWVLSYANYVFCMNYGMNYFSFEQLDGCECFSAYVSWSS